MAVGLQQLKFYSSPDALSLADALSFAVNVTIDIQETMR